MAVNFAKCLVRFTSVCREWFSLIKSHEFALKQHNATRANLYKNNFQFFIASQTSSSTDNSNFLWLPYYDSFEISAKFKCSPCEHIFISNPCNGIVCLYISGNRNAGAFLLWNPTTREVRPLPFLLPPTIPPTQAPNYIGFCFGSFGLGFDPISKAYKVFVVLFDPSHMYPEYVPVEIYNLRTDTWKLLPENSFHHSMRHCYRSAVLYGSVCSWIRPCDPFDYLVSFDFVEETFIKTQYPERFLKGHVSDFLPVLLPSNKEDAKPHVICWFCTSYTPGDRRDIKIWVLDGYGTNGRWSLHNVIEFQHYESISGPWVYWQGEELLLRQSYSAEENYVELPFLSYNPTTKCLRSTSYEKANDQVYGHGFIESIVSITGSSQRHEFDHGQDGSPESFYTCNLQEVDTLAASSTTHRYYYPKWYIGIYLSGHNRFYFLYHLQA